MELSGMKEYIFNRFDTIPECDIQMGRRTDRQNCSAISQ